MAETEPTTHVSVVRIQATEALGRFFTVEVGGEKFVEIHQLSDGSKIAIDREADKFSKLTAEELSAV